MRTASARRHPGAATIGEVTDSSPSDCRDAGIQLVPPGALHTPIRWARAVLRGLAKSLDLGHIPGVLTIPHAEMAR
jgi:hypothetical protein